MSMWRRREKVRRVRVGRVPEVRWRPPVEEVEPAVVQPELPHLDGPVRTHEVLGPAAHLLQPPLLAALVLEPDLEQKKQKYS